MLELLFAFAQKHEEQDIQFDHPIPVWDVEKKIITEDLRIHSTLFFMKSDVFILMAEYAEVADVIEGRVAPPY